MNYFLFKSHFYQITGAKFHQSISGYLARVSTSTAAAVLNGHYRKSIAFKREGILLHSHSNYNGRTIKSRGCIEC